MNKQESLKYLLDLMNEHSLEYDRTEEEQKFFAALHNISGSIARTLDYENRREGFRIAKQTNRPEKFNKFVNLITEDVNKDKFIKICKLYDIDWDEIVDCHLWLNKLQALEKLFECNDKIWGE